MYKINKEFHFSASHQLNGLPTEHPCSNLHGHNYVAIFHFRASKLNEIGFIIDYRELEPIKRFIDSNLDHKNLNDVLNFNTTAENLSNYLFECFRDEFKELYKVEVSETPKTKASYEVITKVLH